LAKSDGDGDLEARLAKAGLIGGSVSADDVLARYQKVTATVEPPAQLGAPAANPALAVPAEKAKAG